MPTRQALPASPSPPLNCITHRGLSGWVPDKLITPEPGEQTSVGHGCPSRDVLITRLEKRVSWHSCASSEWTSPLPCRCLGLTRSTGQPLPQACTLPRSCPSIHSPGLNWGPIQPPLPHHPPPHPAFPRISPLPAGPTPSCKAPAPCTSPASASGEPPHPPPSAWKPARGASSLPAPGIPSGAPHCPVARSLPVPSCRQDTWEPRHRPQDPAGGQEGG